jgi:hypothetical protein
MRTMLVAADEEFPLVYRRLPMPMGPGNKRRDDMGV